MKSHADISGNNRSLGSISFSSIGNLLPRSISNKHKMNSSILKKSRLNSENIPPYDPNIQADNLPPNSKQSPSKVAISQRQVSKLEAQEQVSPPTPDPPVKVVARIRPPNCHEREGDQTVRKVSGTSVSVGDRKFDFDSVLDSKSSQEDTFQLVGVSMVESALAGYNTSILACGQTGSGKTYTMWGPPSAMVDCQSSNSNQGIVPRIFQMLFTKIHGEQERAEEGKQINYQCRCSFLEIYNEKIGDLIDPTQRNLEIKDDAKNGFYVENLTEEYVTSYEDVTQLLIKGLSNRKVGATSINSKSSRSHIVFTCIIESWCKSTSSKCFGSSKTSRITLVDLAGLEKNKLDDDGRQCVKEAKCVKKSTSQLGHLVNILAERTQSGQSEGIPYENSCLTHLLRESLGGNSKLTVICAISPDNKCNGETISTLRFGHRVKSIHNKPVVNEITEDDVNDLSDQIRQLKEELIRAKSNACYSVGGNNGNYKGRSVRQSLNQLRVSLNRSLILPRLDADVKEEVHIDEEDVRELRLQIDKLHSSLEENSQETSESRGMQFFSLEGCETELTSEHYASCREESENEEINSEKLETELQYQNIVSSMDNLESSSVSWASDHPASRCSISINPCRQSVALHDLALTESPKIGNAQRKSIVFSSSHLAASQDNMLESSKFRSHIAQQSQKDCNPVRSSLQSSKIFSGPTESLAASLQRGLQIIDNHQRNSLVALSFEHLAMKPSLTSDKVNASVQTSQEGKQCSDELSASFICATCQQRALHASNDVQDSLKTWIIAVDESGNPNEMGDKVSKDAVKDLAEAIKREKELENLCKEQAAKIEKLNQLVGQYKQETEEGGSNSLHLEGSKSEMSPIDELRHGKYNPPSDGTKLLGWNDNKNHDPEIIKEKCETKEVQGVLDHEYRAVSFDMNERESLLKEIESLRSKLQSYTEASAYRSEKLRSSLLSQSIQLRKSGTYPRENSAEELENERERWTEMESEWICLTDELRIDLESNRQRAEKVEMELRLEKKCTEELDDALIRAVLGHARMVEHYADLQEKYNELVGKHRLIMEGIAEVKKAAAKAGAKGHGSRFAKSLAAELSVLRVEREKERELLKNENRSLKIQLRDTAEAVHAAGELLVRLREAEEATSVTEEKFTTVQEENEKLRKQLDKLKRKHKMEMITMKQYLAESRLPEAALRPLYREDSDKSTPNDTAPLHDDDQAWRAEFGAIYQDHY